MRDDQARLLDILEAIGKIGRYSHIDKDAFDRDELIQTWMVYHLFRGSCIIGRPHGLRSAPQEPRPEECLARLRRALERRLWRLAGSAGLS